MVGLGAGAGGGGAVEQEARASSSNGMESGTEMILITMEYGQKRSARLVLIFDAPA